MFHLIFAESALELVPDEIRGHPAVRNQAQRSGKKPTEDILDGTFHHSAMKRLQNFEQRGRPDIIHMALLVAQGSILNREGHLRTYIHTINNELIEVDPKTRLPRNLERFKGLISRLIVDGELKGRTEEEGAELLKLTKKMTLEKILEKIAPDKVYGLDDHQNVMTFKKVLRSDGLGPKDLEKMNIAVIAGAFPHGEFKTNLSKIATKVFSIYGDTLELWTVVANILIDAERALGLNGSD
jgi:rRNA small subunit pseudouridine methyltransferase Nep1